MEIYILTDFYSLDEAYSLCGVVSEQLSMLREYNPILIVDEAFPKSGTPWHEFKMQKIPGIPRSNSFKPPVEKDVERMRAAMSDILKSGVVITHDMIYQPSMVGHHAAARKVAAENPNLRWLHWIHSATPCFARQHSQYFKGVFPNSKIVFPNEYDQSRVAANYNVPESDVVFVPHSTDPVEFLMQHELSKQLAREINLLEADVIGCYPARLDRGKQVEIGIEIFAGIKNTGKSVRYIIFDFHSTGGDKVSYRRSLESKCAELGLAVGREVVFVSEWRKETKYSSPRQMVKDFMTVGDLLILPSRSETYSLVAQEAALCKNLLVLNFDFPPMRSIYGRDALYEKFSSDIDALSGANGRTETKYENRQDYMNRVALRAVSYLEESMTLRQFRLLRKTRNPKAVLRDYLEPLIWRGS